MRFNQITIVGVGLIGGSFALAARRAGIAERIIGWDAGAVLEEACGRGVIDGVDRSFESGGVCDADLVYLAAPVGAIMSFLRTRGTMLRPGVIVTDAGSTKREICRTAREALPHPVSFIGGHPMAGSHNAGVEYADADLFQGAPYALVVEKGKAESGSALQRMDEIVRGIGARPVRISAEEHDRVVARVSHAPQLLATALARAIARRKSEADLRLAGSGFSEMVRMAASSWSMWEDICRTNADEIALALDEVISELDGARSSVAGGDFDSVRVAFEEAKGLVRQSSSPKESEDAWVEETPTPGCG